MSQLRVPIPLSAIVLATLACVSGCSRLYHFEGIVVDGGGSPVADASILLYPKDWERPPTGPNNGTSVADGSFKATWGNAVGVDYFHLVVAKQGYEEAELVVEADAKGIRVVLQSLKLSGDSKEVER